MTCQSLKGGFSRWLLAPALCVTLVGCRTTTFVDGSETTALRFAGRSNDLVIKTDEGRQVHVGKESRLSFLLQDGSWTAPIDGRDLCVSEQALARCAEDGPPGPSARWADVRGVEVDNFDGAKTFGTVVLVTALVAVVVVVVVLAANGGGGGLHLGGGGLGGGGGRLAGGGGGHAMAGSLHASGGHVSTVSPGKVGRPGEDLWRQDWDGADDDRKRARVVPVPLEGAAPLGPVLPLFKRSARQHGGATRGSDSS